MFLIIHIICIIIIIILFDEEMKEENYDLSDAVDKISCSLNISEFKSISFIIMIIIIIPEIILIVHIFKSFKNK